MQHFSIKTKGLAIITLTLLALTACQNSNALGSVDEGRLAHQKWRLAHFKRSPELKAGYTAYWRNDFATALKHFRPLADKGDAFAQLYFGRMYEYGEGVTKVYNAAKLWVGRAANQSDVAAQFWLGKLYRYGKVVTADQAAATNLYRMAAGQGYAEAQHRLGTSYHRGWGVAEDDKEAVRWYRKSAVQGYPGAQGLIATMPTSSEQGKPATLPHPLASAGFRTT